MIKLKDNPQFPINIFNNFNRIKEIEGYMFLLHQYSILSGDPAKQFVDELIQRYPYLADIIDELINYFGDDHLLSNKVKDELKYNIVIYLCLFPDNFEQFLSRIKDNMIRILINIYDRGIEGYDLITISNLIHIRCNYLYDLAIKKIKNTI